MRKRCISILLAMNIILLSGCENIIPSEPSSSDIPAVDESIISDTLETDTKIETSEIANNSASEIDVTTTVVTVKAPLVTVDSIPESFQLDVEPIMQEPELPTGCEITSLTCLLNYLGFNVDKVIMADTYLDYVTENGSNYSFFEKYIGNPHGNGYGCYSPVIVKAAEKYLADQNSSMDPINLSGSSSEELFKVIASGHPIVIWNTVYAQYVEGEYAWETPSGEAVYWNNYEHCMLLIGYDLYENSVTVCDPLRGKVQYDKDQFFDVYDNLMYQQAMTIY